MKRLVMAMVGLCAASAMAMPTQAKLSDAKLKAVVEAEAKNVEAGEFWWAYEPAMEAADDIFKAHAAAFFR